MISLILTIFVLLTWPFFLYFCGMFVHTSACSCVYRCIYVFRCVCVEAKARLTLGFLFQALPTLFVRQALWFAQNSLILWGRLAGEFRVQFSSISPRLRLQVQAMMPEFFYKGCRITLKFSFLHIRALLNGLSPWPLFCLFVCLFFNSTQ